MVVAVGDVVRTGAGVHRLGGKRDDRRHDEGGGEARHERGTRHVGQLPAGLRVLDAAGDLLDATIDQIAGPPVLPLLRQPPGRRGREVADLVRRVPADPPMRP